MQKLHKAITEKEALRESEARYRSIFESSTDSFLIFDAGGNIVEANPQACKMYGYSYGELIKLSGKDIVHPDYHHLFEQFKRDVQATGEFQAESIDLRKDGTAFNIEVRGTQFDYNGTKHLLAVIRDVTKRKRTQETLKQKSEEQKALLSTIPAFVYFKDRDLNYITANKALADMTGTSIDEIAGKTDYDFFPKEEADFYRRCDQEVMESREPKYNIEEPVTGADGNKMWVSTSKTPFFDSDGKVVGMVGITFDITSQKQTQEEFLKKHDELERFAKLAVGRELRMIELKKEINALLEELGKEPKYRIVTES